MIELRCPNVHGKLFGKLAGPSTDTTGRIEISCPDCRTALRKSGQPTRHVMHLFDFQGRHTLTRVVSE